MRDEKSGKFISKYSIEYVRELAEKYNCKCHSEYINATTKMNFSCSNNHKWNEKFVCILQRLQKRNVFCFKCDAENKKYQKLTDCKNYAISKNGICLSNVYKDRNSKLLWRCENNHQWYSSYSSTISGNHWCAKCAGIEKLSIDEARNIAISRGGACLSNVYINRKSKLKWQCSAGHIWESSMDCVKQQNTWCPYCYGNVTCTIEEMKNIAKERNGECLSDNYINAHTLLKWKCNIGHTWNANANNIKSGKWCPECAILNKEIGSTEKYCKKVFEYIFNHKFEKIQPSWLIGPFQKPLELDGYCKELNIAFEYNGLQHYQPVSFLYVDEERLKTIQHKDKIKLKICKKLGIKLIVIPPFKNLVKRKIFNCILNQLEKENLLPKPKKEYSHAEIE